MRVLVETARRGSFTGAAAALGMTQPAVSYQVRRMEEQAGFEVLRRGRHGIELTASGRKLLAICARTVTEVDDLLKEHRIGLGRPAVRLHTDYAFSSLWLIPRMHAFRPLHPDIDLQIVATQRFRPEDMEAGDIAIAFGERRDFGAAASLILAEAVVPVCTAAYLALNGPFGDANALAKARLVHLEAQSPSPWLDWTRYLAAFGAVRSSARHAGDLSFNTYSLVTQAAMENQGLALGWKGLVELAAALRNSGAGRAGIAPSAYGILAGASRGVDAGQRKADALAARRAGRRAQAGERLTDPLRRIKRATRARLGRHMARGRLMRCIGGKIRHVAGQRSDSAPIFFRSVDNSPFKWCGRFEFPGAC